MAASEAIASVNDGRKAAGARAFTSIVHLTIQNLFQVELPNSKMLSVGFSTCWRMPPESSLGRLSRAGVRFTVAMYLSMCSRRLADVHDGKTWSTARAMFSCTVSHGSRL